MTEVLHTADTHVGYRQYNSPERRADFLSAFERVVAAAIERDVDAVVHAGDVFHDRRPGLQDLLGTVDVLRDLADAGIPFLAVVGNHEDKREAQWLDLFERLDLATHLDAGGTVVGDTTFYGLDYVPASGREDLDYEFTPPETDHAALVAHGAFAPLAPAVGRSPWDVEAVLDAANVAFDAVLLGDEHEPGQADVDGTWVTYSGSTERTSASERDERGYNVVAFDDGVDVRRRGLDTRPFRFVDVELRADEGTERVRERVREFDVEDAVVVVTVTGDGEEVTPAAVEELARERGALVARVNDRRDRQTDAGTPDVSFADPDSAVRERVREMGLSAAARDVDEAVRSSGLADSNVREEVKRRVEAAREDDPDAFERVSDDGGDGSGDSEGADGGETVDGTDREDETVDTDDDGTDHDGDTARAAEEDGAAVDEATGDDPGGESQASMEEYL
jgi:exonuclease SbcD